MPLSILTELWLPLVAAALVCGLALGVPRLLSRRPAAAAPTPGVWASLVPPMALVAGPIALHVWHVGRPVWPPPGLTERLLPAFVLAGVLGAAGGLSRRSFTAGAWGFVCTGAAVAVVLWPMLAWGSPHRAISVEILLGVSVLAGVACASLAALEHQGHPVAVAIILMGMSLASGAAPLGSGSFSLGQHGLALGVAVLGVWLVLLPARGRLAPGAACSGLAIGAALLVGANRYSELRPVPPLLLGLAAPAALLAAWLLSRKVSLRKSGVVAVLVAAVVAALAVGLSVDVSGTADASSAGDDSGYGP